MPSSSQSARRTRAEDKSIGEGAGGVLTGLGKVTAAQHRRRGGLIERRRVDEPAFFTGGEERLAFFSRRWGRHRGARVGLQVFHPTKPADDQSAGLRLAQFNQTAGWPGR